MSIGEKIKLRRMELGWSQRELSKRMKYSNHSTIARIETGHVDIPQSRIVQFAEVLNTTVAYLMDWEEVEKKNDTISDAVVRMRSESRFLSVVEILTAMDPEDLETAEKVLKALAK